MQLQTIKFTADEQSLQRTSGGSLFASSTVSYIRALFDLGDNWGSWGAVRAVWKSRTQQIATVLADGACMVPAEVLANPGQVYVNLVASEVSGNVVTDRLTSYPVLALVVDAQALVDGSETAEITPSQFEQFVEAVEGYSSQAIDARDRAEAAQEAAETAQGKAEDAQEAAEAALHEFTTPTASAETLQPGSAATAAYSAGHFTFGIPQGEKGDPGDQGETGATPDFSIGSVTTGEPGTDAAASITGTAENPVLNLTIPRGDTGEVSQEELYDLLPVDSASGSIASFIDGAKNVPLKSLVIDIDPVQDLHGYANPWPAGGGKNLLNPGANETIFGITKTVNADGTIRFNGTATGVADFYFNGTTVAGTTLDIPDGTYHLYGTEQGSTSTYRIFMIYIKNGQTYYANGGDHTAIEWDKTTTGRLFLRVYSGATIDVTLKLSFVSGTQDAWTPYENICPISGWTGANVTAAGGNCINYGSNVEGSINDIGQEVATATFYRTAYIQVTSDTGIISVASVGDGYNISIHGYDASGVWLQQIKAVLTDGNPVFESFAIPSTVKQIRVSYPKAASGVELWQGTTTPITWQDSAGTVYGGHDEVISGSGKAQKAKLTIDENTAKSLWGGPQTPWVGIVIDSTVTGMASGRQSGLLSNMLKSVDYNITSWNVYGVNGNLYITLDSNVVGNTLNSINTWLENNNIEIVCPLATPSNFSTTPITIESLYGQNNIFADTGDTAAEYRADIQLFINKMLANALSA